MLAYVSPARGHLYPIVSTLLELQQRGHQVTIRTLASEVDGLSSIGLHAAAIDQRVEAREMDDWRGRNQLDQLHRALTAFVDGAQDKVGDLEEAIEH